MFLPSDLGSSLEDSPAWYVLFKEYYEALGIPVNTYYPLLTEGDKESYGVDYGEVLAPCTQISSVCLVFVLSLAYQLQVHHVNVETAFLNSPLQEELYVEREGCYYAKSIKSLYGHKQAGKTWFDTSEASILAYDSHLKKSVVEPSLLHCLPRPHRFHYMLCGRLRAWLRTILDGTSPALRPSMRSALARPPVQLLW
ncbi:hypothetical protein CYMTET_41681 [Cymbomonas tetramitiformis]|uniref:Reverse transcriptase Ty1/copia-type domain-containing protein n=1 Tax=Cymbomonas tetramitiformis TaxID=36881 RepID=A0AAE0C5L8_9CHLO|nr:hypothetical protein CYMTET_41681 [Cymbomonas tetramitiformis]